MLSVLYVTMSLASATPSSTVAACYSSAESDNPGLSITAKLGTTTILTSGDLDAVMAKVAEKHLDASLDLTYNSAGRYAIKQALDCIFDAGVASLSGIWVNENEPDLSVRNYTLAVGVNGTPTDWMTFTKTFTRNGAPWIGFGSSTTGDCYNLEFQTYQTYDRIQDIDVPPDTPDQPGHTVCQNEDCTDTCEGGGDVDCSCPGDGGCVGVTGPNPDKSNGAIIKVAY
jgi:hypothetical protein